MRIVLFVHDTGRLAVRPLLAAGETHAAIIRLLRPIPCRLWHPREHLWTLPLDGPWAEHFLTVLVRCGFALENSEPPAIHRFRRRFRPVLPRRLFSY